MACSTAARCQDPWRKLVLPICAFLILVAIVVAVVLAVAHNSGGAAQTRVGRELKRSLAFTVPLRRVRDSHTQSHTELYKFDLSSLRRSKLFARSCDNRPIPPDFKTPTAVRCRLRLPSTKSSGVTPSPPSPPPIFTGPLRAVAYAPHLGWDNTRGDFFFFRTGH